VVAGERAARVVLRQLLEGHGATVLEAGSAESARVLAAAPAGQIELAFVDIYLSLDRRDRGGLDLVRELRHAGVSVVVVSSLCDARDVRAAFRLGADDYLLKDESDVESLRSIVQRAHHRTQERLGQTARRFAAEEGASPRQAEIITALTRGVPPACLHLELGVARTSIRTQVRRLLRKGGHAGLDEVLRAVLREHDETLSAERAASTPAPRTTPKPARSHSPNRTAGTRPSTFNHEPPKRDDAC